MHLKWKLFIRLTYFVDVNVSSIVIQAFPKDNLQWISAHCIGDIYQRNQKSVDVDDQFLKDNWFLSYEKPARNPDVDT